MSRLVREALQDAELQIRYLHERLGYETGSGNAVLTKISIALEEVIHEEIRNQVDRPR